MEQDRKKTEEALAEIYRNAQLALTSIANILPEVGEDERLKNELHAQHEEYEQFSAKACMLARDGDIEIKQPSPMKKDEHDDGQLSFAHCGDDAARDGNGDFRPAKNGGRTR